MSFDKYIDEVTKIGRVTMILGVLVSILPPIIMTFVFGFIQD